MLRNKNLNIQLSKFSNVKLIYITPKNQVWGVFNSGLKKCIKKSFKDIEKVNNFFDDKKFISYKDSKYIKKGWEFKILENSVKIKTIHIKFLTKTNRFKSDSISKNITKENETNDLQSKKKNLHHMRSFTFIDLFSGAGGFSFGLKKAGLKHIYGIDSCKIACKTYTKNVGFSICGDLQILKPLVLEQKVDVLIGSPPCQSFSLANRRKTNKSKGSFLYLSYFKYLEFYNPKIFILENVLGLLSYKTENNVKVIDEMIKIFSTDYLVKVVKVCSSDFGVVQKRKRVLIIGVRKDYKVFFPELKKSPCHENLRSLLLPRSEVDNSFFLSERALAGIARRKKINTIKKNGFGAHYLNLDFFCNTITANYWKDGYSSLVKYNENKIRRLTELELKRIQSFPDSFNFSGSKKEKYMQIGNAVPPNLAYFLGKQIIKFLQENIKNE